MGAARLWCSSAANAVGSGSSCRPASGGRSKTRSCLTKESSSTCPPVIDRHRPVWPVESYCSIATSHYDSDVPFTSWLTASSTTMVRLYPIQLQWNKTVYFFFFFIIILRIFLTLFFSRFTFTPSSLFYISVNSGAYYLKDHPSKRLFCLHVDEMDPSACAVELSGK